jgi:hypothetical protein
MRPTLLQSIATRTRKRAPLSSRRARMRDEQPSADLAVRRARDAGGPVDCASYSCPCGFTFTATVSTTVACPHCGTAQAW